MDSEILDAVLYKIWWVLNGIFLQLGTERECRQCLEHIFQRWTIYLPSERVICMEVNKQVH